MFAPLIQALWRARTGPPISCRAKCTTTSPPGTGALLHQASGAVNRYFDPVTSLEFIIVYASICCAKVLQLMQLHLHARRFFRARTKVVWVAERFAPASIRLARATVRPLRREAKVAQEVAHQHSVRLACRTGLARDRCPLGSALGCRTRTQAHRGCARHPSSDNAEAASLPMRLLDATPTSDERARASLRHVDCRQESFRHNGHADGAREHAEGLRWSYVAAG